MTNLNEVEFDQQIAIVGMACHLPGAKNTEEFWNNLINGVESISTFTDEELLEAGVEPELIQSPNYVKSRGIINGAEYFDASFFGFTPREAELMDPQHRVFLECAWHALEDAAYNPEKSNARIGVYGGTGTPWHLFQANMNPEVKKFASGTSIVTSNDKDYVATRVSYKLNLTGPSVNVQCACSTSMVAVILGMNSLLNYQCDMVLAGGSTIELPEKKGYIYQQGGLESPDGHCRTFDEGANGTVFSRGAGVVLIKRLNDAIKDGDNIYAVIKGGAINNDGNKKVGFTAPSIEGQIEVITETIELADIKPETISYVEAHGTATQIGDPIEVSSLIQAFEQFTDKKQFCAIGSVKTNIGHTDSASGVSSLIKAALSLKNRKIPASLNYYKPNPQIDFENSPFFVNTELRKWIPNGSPLRALVNSFGVGGTNACVVLEEAPDIKSDDIDIPNKLLVLSAKSREALEQSKNNLANYIGDKQNVNLNDLVYTYQIGRKYFNNRGFLTFKNRDELLEKLNNENSLQVNLLDKEDKPIVFMFPGQGNQYVNMGLELYNNEKVFKDAVDECCKIILEEFGFNLKDIIYPNNENYNLAIEKINQTKYTQPALFVISYAQAKLLMSWEIEPDVMIGHSVGEYVAACISGVFSLRDAVKAITKRGELIQSLPGGSMLAILLSKDEVQPFLSSTVEIAAINNPSLTVVAGPDEDIDKLIEELSSKKIFNKRLSTSHAFHSQMMEAIMPEFEKYFSNIDLHPPQIPIISTVSGDTMAEQQALDIHYWVQHVRKAVVFAYAAKTCIDDKPYVFIEVGPGQSLESAVKRQLDRDSEHSVISTMPSANDEIPDLEYLTTALGRLWISGVSISWQNYYKEQNRKRISLPGYPFERKPYSIDFSKNKDIKVEKANQKESDIGKWFYLPSWARSSSLDLLMNDQDYENKNCWLIFNDDLGLAKTISEQLKNDGKDIINIFASDKYHQENENTFYIEASNSEQYIKVLDELIKQNRKPQMIIHLWNITQLSEKEFDFDEVETIKTMNFYSIIYTEQALIKLNLFDDVHISVVANGTFDITGETVFCPEKALAIGPCRVIGKEFPSMQARFIDITIPDVDISMKYLANNLIKETLYKANETVVAYRKHHRWKEEFNQVYLEESDDNIRKLKDNGVYLITGGLGGLGLLFSKFIAETVKSKLILTYYSDIPKREEWQNWLDTHDNNNSTSEKINGIIELESLGADVMIYQVDVSDLQGMKNLVQEAEAKFGTINGIIHSAGIAGGGIISLKTPEMANQVLDPKIKGTIVLDSIFDKKELDFMILFSSITAILGEAGRVDYCSANSFLDAYAYYKNQEGHTYTSSINWGQWGDVGMAVRWEESQAKSKAELLKKAKSINKNDKAKEIIQLVKKENNLSIYQVNLDPVEDWEVNSHFIYGIPTAVGTTFIDILNKYANSINSNGYNIISDLYFMTPLMFPDSKERKVRLYVKKQNDKYQCSIKSQEIEKDSDNDSWTEHCVANIQVESQQTKEIIDIESLKNKFGNNVQSESLTRVVKGNGDIPLLELGERWNCEKQIHIGENEWLAEIELDKKYNDDFINSILHPAMLDVATMLGIQHITDNQFLPFHYSRIKIYSSIPAKIFSHIYFTNKSNDDSETLSFEITILDTAGNIILEIENYTLKKVKEDMQIGESKDKIINLSNKSKNTITHNLKSKDIFIEEGKEAFKRFLSKNNIEQIVISTSDLHQSIIDSFPTIKSAEDDEDASKKQSSAYERPALSTPYVEPTNEIEKAISEIWQSILGIDKIGINDDFTELGGNSLLAIQTLANISDTFQVEMQAEDFFKNSTVKGLAEVILELLLSLTNEDDLEELISSIDDED